MAHAAHDPTPESLLPLPTAAFHILVALADTDRHGYAVMQEVAQRTGGKIRLNPGTLYTTIKRLLEQGLIDELDERPDPESHDERRRYYRLTRFGRQVAEAEMARLNAMLALGRSAGLSPSKAKG
jgi:DNA-binding PadR family transcriptional regulator